MAIVYFFATLLAELLVYVGSHDVAPILFRILCAAIGAVAVIILYCMTYTSARLAYHAHKPYNYLNRLMAKKSIMMIKTMKRSIGSNRMKITNEMRDFKLKFNVLTLIERLAGPTIGIYCLDLFPFTNYEFYQYVVAASSLYFLLLGNL
jgi:hypothetical protein